MAFLFSPVGMSLLTVLATVLTHAVCAAIKHNKTMDSHLALVQSVIAKVQQYAPEAGVVLQAAEALDPPLTKPIQEVESLLTKVAPITSKIAATAAKDLSTGTLAQAKTVDVTPAVGAAVESSNTIVG